MKVRSPTPDTIQRLSREPGVSAIDVRQALLAVEGMTLDQALAFVDRVRYSRGWTNATYLAIAEGIDTSRCDTHR